MGYEGLRLSIGQHTLHVAAADGIHVRLQKKNARSQMRSGI